MQWKRKRQSLASRVAAVHFAVCGLAILGAGLVQIPWDAVLGRSELVEWQPQAVGAGMATTAWLLATAWLHRELGRRGDQRPRLTQNDSRFQLLGDSLLTGIAAAIIWRGHESPLAAAGAWMLCPAVLVIGILSGMGLGLERMVANGGEPTAQERLWMIRGRLLLAAVLIVVLAVMSAGKV